MYVQPVCSQVLPLFGDRPALLSDAYNPAVPVPDEILGYRLGTKHTYPHLIVRYFEEVAGRSDRVQVGVHGTTHDDKPLIHALITSPENFKRLEEIRLRNLLLSSGSNTLVEQDLSEMPAVVWMGYGVHGNEASSFEAAMLLLYHLAAGESEFIESLLTEAVILLIPSLNPDGHLRHVHWVNSNRGSVPTGDPHGREHNEPWPGGRTNYYWFDLNRDWLPLQHPESRARMQLYNEWRPQIVADFHEMGSNDTYFFQPGVSSRYNPQIPAGSIGLLNRIGSYHASALDESGVLYFSNEIFDDFYIGKGSTYPMVTGSIGILFEQASSRALMRETDHGILHFSDAIYHQFTTSVSTLSAVQTIRIDLLKNQLDFYRSSNHVASRSPVKAFIIDGRGDQARLHEFARLLQRHRIKVYALKENIEMRGKRYAAGEAVVIPVDQAEARLILASLGRMTEFADSIFYDVSTWTLPLAFGLDCLEYMRHPGGLLGAELPDSPTPSRSVPFTAARYAYVLDWNDFFAPRTLFRIQNQEIRTYVSSRPLSLMTADGQIVSLDRGAVIIPVKQSGIDENRIHAAVADLALEERIKLYPINSGRSLAGPDLGSPAISVLEKPEIALVVGRGVSAGEAGEVWYLLNERFQMPLALIDIDRLSQVNLNKYNTLILVHGNYSGLGHQQIQNIKDMVGKGGLLIATKNASRFIIENQIAEGSVSGTDVDSLAVPYESIRSIRGAHRVGGVIFEAVLDHTHPVGYGFDVLIPIFRNHEVRFELSPKSGENVARYTDDPVLSGYLSDRRLNELRGSAAIIAQKSGEGHIVLFADNPNFRSFWYGTNRLFLNALFFGKSF